MTPNAHYRNDARRGQTQDLDVDACEPIAPLQSMSTPELELMQDVTLNEMRATPPGVTLLLLGRVWYRLEQERRRRAAELAELERMYFAH